MPLEPLTTEELQSFRGSDQPTAAPSIPAQISARAIGGTEKSKDPFSESQKKAAGFAVRMESAIEEMEALENSGFDPVNFKDSILVEYAPFIPDIAENYLKSPKYQVYQRAVNDFLTAQLRKESGAQINDSEFDLTSRTYLPLPGDSQEVLNSKRKARRSALAAMKGDAGKAYERTRDIVSESSAGADPSKDQALQILIERAKKNPQLAQELRRRGLIP